MWSGCDLVLNDFVWFYGGLVRLEWVCFGGFGVFWCSLVWFVDANQCFMVWSWCDLFWRIWCYFIHVWLDWSGFILVWCLFSVVWCDFDFSLMLINVLWCEFRVIWCDYIQVSLDWSGFALVVWCHLVWFGVIGTFMGC